MNKKKFPDRDLLELFQEFEEMGYVHHICPDCGEHMDGTEIDSNKAFCPWCEESKIVEPAI